jgi:hypothetical protein
VPLHDCLGTDTRVGVALFVEYRSREDDGVAMTAAVSGARQRLAGGTDGFE